MCCMDGETQYPKGDASTTHVLEIYNQPHLRRLRVHTRLPVVLPERVDEGLLAVAAAWYDIGTAGEMHHDPVVWALRDKTSWAAAVGVGVALLAASGVAP